jgi:hypothetical protein
MKIRLIAILTLLTACSAESVGRQLSWVRTTQPEILLREANRSGRFEFLEVCGLVCATPNLGVLTYDRCYRSVAAIRKIDDTGDVITSDLQDSLKREAQQLAGTYNPMLMAALDGSGKRACGSHERWDGLWRAMAGVTEEVPRNPYVTSLSANSRSSWGGYDFHLHVPDSTAATPQLFARLCSFGPKFGVTKRLLFKVTSGDINNGPVPHRGFVCLDGNVAT